MAQPSINLRDTYKLCYTVFFLARKCILSITHIAHIALQGITHSNELTAFKIYAKKIQTEFRLMAFFFYANFSMTKLNFQFINFSSKIDNEHIIANVDAISLLWTHILMHTEKVTFNWISCYPSAKMLFEWNRNAVECKPFGFYLDKSMRQNITILIQIWFTSQFHGRFI